jgi:phosphoribulokinase
MGYKQFSQTDINFQRIATVDTSNPFITRDIPTPDESLVVIRFKDLNKTPVDFPTVKSMPGLRFEFSLALCSTASSSE